MLPEWYTSGGPPMFYIGISNFFKENEIQFVFPTNKDTERNVTF